MNTELTNTCQPSACETQAKPANAYRTPAYHISEQEDAFVLSVDVPGAPRDAVSVSLENKELKIEANRKVDTPEAWKVINRGIPAADYRLSLSVEADIDADKLSAKLENGVLRVTLPKAEQMKPRKITIE